MYRHTMKDNTCKTEKENRLASLCGKGRNTLYRNSDQLTGNYTTEMLAGFKLNILVHLQR